MLIAGCDPGKLSDSFGFVVIRVEKDDIIVRAAKRWLGRDYTDVERTIAKFHTKHNFDHIVVEQNNTGVHVIEVLKRKYNLPIIAVITSNNLKDNKKVASARVMDKNLMANYIAGLMKDHKIKFPTTGGKDMKELERQIAIFAEHRTEAGNVAYYAPGNEHDDLAMALMLAIHIGKYYLRSEGDTSINVMSKPIIAADEDILGTGVPIGAIPKESYTRMP